MSAEWLAEAYRPSLTLARHRVIAGGMGAGPARERLSALYWSTRARTEALASLLSPEDQQLQSMPDASPTKWHRAHTTWFFETFLLLPRGIPAHSPSGAYLWNSYYEAVGSRHPRAERGLLSRPTAEEVSTYRRSVDARVVELLSGASTPEERALALLGIAHEEQHQELILTDILHAFSRSPLRPAYRLPPRSAALGEGATPSSGGPATFVEQPGGLLEVGALPGEDELAFAFDNEGPRHKVWVEPFALADRLVTVGEVKAFIRDGGYRSASLWLAEGYAWVQAEAVSAPLYATLVGDTYETFSLDGPRVAMDDEPAAHLSYYEADAVARYLGARLPTEIEWEVAATRAGGGYPVRGNFAEDDRLRPVTASSPASPPETSLPMRQLFGDVWQWTSTSYGAYPRYRPPPGAVGEYNGKFMSGQMVLRGGSCLSPSRHLRASYRNFWPPATRFQMTGLRLAKDS